MAASQCRFSRQGTVALHAALCAALATQVKVPPAVSCMQYDPVAQTSPGLPHSWSLFLVVIAAHLPLSQMLFFAAQSYLTVQASSILALPWKTQLQASSILARSAGTIAVALV